TYFGAVLDWAFDVQWADADSQNAPNLVVGESFELAYYLENLGNVELKNVEVAGAAPVYSGQTIDGDSDADGRIDPGEMWKYETLGTVELGEQNQSVTVAAVSTVLDMPIVGFLDTSYFGEYRSLAVTSTADSGIGSLRYAIEDAASRPEGGQIYFDFSALGAELSAGKTFLIQPLSPLPALDGSSAIEILGSDHVSVVLDGSLAGSSHGLEIISDGNVVQDLTIQNFELAGIHVLGSENTISGNRIGLSVLDGEAGNGGDGIWIEAGSQNLIGGVDEDGVDQNIIAHNAGNGVAVEGGIANRIGTNAFFENAGMGIDLGRNGFTPNDSLADSGANNLISTPVITRIEIVGQTVEIDYQVPVNSAEMADSLRIEFFQADSSRREGAKFLGTDIYTVQDFVAGGKTLVVEVDEFPDFDMRIVATATSAQGNTSEFSAPSGISFTGRSVKAEQQDAVDNVADGILAKLESLLSGKTSTPALTPGQPSIVANKPVYDFVLADKVVDEILIGRNVFAQDETDCALNVGSGDDPLVMIGFGEEVDDVTMAVNDYCVEQVYDLADSLSLTPGQMVAVIWFDPINFTVSIGDNQVSYDYDNNPTELSGSIPGASLVVTSGSATTPGGVQGIMFAGDVSTINVQMSTTSSGELMRGGVNIYTVGTGAGGTTIQPSIRTVFQGHLPGESVMMAFDPSAAPQLLARTGGRGSQSLAGISGADSPGGGGGGGGIPGLIPGMFSGANGFQLAFLDPASMANAALDISGSTTEAGEDGSDAEDLENQVQEEFGTEATDEREEEDETELDGREEGDEESSGEFDEAPPVEDEEEIEESISGIFDILGNALASTSGRIDVMDILTPESSTQNHQASSFTKDAEVTVARWTHNESAYDQRVSDRWATSFDAQESEKTWTEALEAARKDG
ncbi:MAG: right-handed parallel beta-helix repeat-containing protein, partial [Planctomycetales bacterium]